MLGLSLLVAWNSLLKSMPYILTQIPHEWQDSAPLLLTLTFCLTNWGVLTFLTLSDADSRLIKKLTGWKETEKIIGGRLYGGLIGCAVILGLACLGPLTDIFGKSQVTGGSMSALLLFWGIFMCAGWLMCLLQRSVYPLMTLIPGNKNLMVPAMLSGQAVSGIAASIGSFLFAGAGKGGAVMALAYFGCSILSLLSTVVLYHQYKKMRTESKSESDKSGAESKPLPKFSIKIIFDTAKMIKPWPQLLSLNFAVTLVLFPGLLTSSARSLSGNKFFIPMTFLAFDAFDLIGKVMPLVVRRGFGPKSKIAMGFPLMRVLFIPAFLLLPNFWLVGEETGVQAGDFWYFGMLALMAWTGGWVNGICLMNGPENAQITSEDGLSEDMGDRIGSLMGLSITFGSLCGSGASFLIKKLIN
jgi:hypothetical protein